MYWNVMAFDGSEYSTWSNTSNFTIESFLSINLTTNSINFGTLDMLQEKDTDTGYSPLVIENNGNILINVSRIGANSSLWSKALLNSQFFQFKADNDSTESGSFNWSGSVTVWANMTSIEILNKTIITLLDYNDSKDNAEIDIRVQAPLDEPPGAKSAAVYIIGEQS